MGIAEVKGVTVLRHSVVE